MRTGRGVNEGRVEGRRRQCMLYAGMEVGHAEGTPSVMQDPLVACRQMEFQFGVGRQHRQISLVSDVAQSRHQHAHRDLRTVNSGALDTAIALLADTWLRVADDLRRRHRTDPALRRWTGKGDLKC